MMNEKEVVKAISGLLAFAVVLGCLNLDIYNSDRGRFGRIYAEVIYPLFY